jgi:BolA protein
MSVQQIIEGKLQTALAPLHLEVENESHRHGGQATESHFRIVAVSEVFDGQMALKRHRQLYGLLEEELAAGVHALALHLYTPQEWTARQQQSPASPDCRGGSKTDPGS